jgi:hypothetical protein
LITCFVLHCSLQSSEAAPAFASEYSGAEATLSRASPPYRPQAPEAPARRLQAVGTIARDGAMAVRHPKRRAVGRRDRLSVVTGIDDHSRSLPSSSLERPPNRCGLSATGFPSRSSPTPFRAKPLLSHPNDESSHRRKEGSAEGRSVGNELARGLSGGSRFTEVLCAIASGSARAHTTAKAGGAHTRKGWPDHLIG